MAARKLLRQDLCWGLLWLLLICLTMLGSR